MKEPKYDAFGNIILDFETILENFKEVELEKLKYEIYKDIEKQDESTILKNINKYQKEIGYCLTRYLDKLDIEHNIRLSFDEESILMKNKEEFEDSLDNLTNKDLPNIEKFIEDYEKKHGIKNSIQLYRGDKTFKEKFNEAEKIERLSIKDETTAKLNKKFHKFLKGKPTAQAFYHDLYKQTLKDHYNFSDHSEENTTRALVEICNLAKVKLEYEHKEYKDEYQNTKITLNIDSFNYANDCSHILMETNLYEIATIFATKDIIKDELELNMHLKALQYENRKKDFEEHIITLNEDLKDFEPLKEIPNLPYEHEQMRQRSYEHCKQNYIKTCKEIIDEYEISFKPYGYEIKNTQGYENIYKFLEKHDPYYKKEYEITCEFDKKLLEISSTIKEFERKQGVLLPDAKQRKIKEIANKIKKIEFMWKTEIRYINRYDTSKAIFKDSIEMMRPYQNISNAKANTR